MKYPPFPIRWDFDGLTVLLALALSLLFAGPAWAGQPTVPAAPAGLTATASSSSSINLSWRDNASDESGYYVDRSTSASGTFSRIAVLGINATSYANTGLSGATTYYYRVSAYNKVGTSAYASASARTLDATAPSVSLTAPTAGSTVSGNITLSATATDNVGVSKVDFYRDGSLVGTDTASPYSLAYNTTTVANGSHSFVAKAYDVAGNIGTSSTVTVTVSNTMADTTPPNISLNTPTAGSTVSGSITLSATASDNVGVSKVEFYRDGSLVGTDTASPYSLAFNTTSVANGLHNFYAKAYDMAGNFRASTTVTATVSNTTSDTTVPVVSLTAPSNGSTVSGTITLSATATDNVGVSKVDFYRDGSLVGTDTTSPYSLAYNTTAVANGSHSFVAKAYDVAGNIGTSATVTVTVSNPTSDTTPPSISLTAPSNGSTVSGNITLSATATDNVGVTKVEFYRDGSLVGTDTASPYSLVFNTATVANGSHTFMAGAYDAAGNVRSTATVTVTVNNTTSDTTPPSISLTSPSNGSTVSGTITLSATATDNVGVSKVDFYRDGSLVGTDTTSPYSLAYNTTTVANGSHSFVAKAYDVAGNIGTTTTVTVTVNNTTSDTTPPSISLTAPSNGSTVSGNITLSATATDNVGVTKVEFYRDGSLVGTDTASPYSLVFNTATVANGSHTFMAGAYDAAGNVRSTATVTVTVNNTTSDTTPPSISLTSPSNGSTVSGTITLSATATDNVGVSKVDFYRDGSLVGTDTTSPYSLAYNTTTVANGSHSFVAKAYDVAGNIGTTTTVTVTVNNTTSDTTPPSISLTAPSNGSTVSGTITLSATATDNVGVTKVEFYRDGILVGTDTASPYSLAFNTATVANGSHTLMAGAYDAAGNVRSTATVTVTVNNTTSDTTPPSISLTSPSNGSTVSGTITLSATATDNVGVSKVDFYRDGSLVGTDTTSPYSLAYNTATVANGSHSFVAKAYDVAGNIGTTSTVTVTVSNTASDTTAPTASLTAPGNGSTVSGTITLSATASDNVGVSKVDFYRDGSLVGTDTTSPYSLAYNTATVANGSHSFVAKAYDVAGNIGTTSTVTVTVNNTASDTTAPTASLTAPVNGSTVSGNITLSATASDNAGVSKVDFYRDGSLVGTDTASPYSLAYNTTTVANGSHSFVAKAYDVAGNIGTSATVTVTVSNSTSDTTAPTVSMTAPSSGSSVSGTVTVAASASDNVGVARVEFYRDSTTLIGSDTSSVYSVADDTTQLSNGSHSYHAKAFDAVGNSTTSPSTTVTVNNTLISGPWATSFGGTDNDGGHAVAVDGSGNVFTAGWFGGVATFGGTSLTSAGGMDNFLTKSSASGTLQWARRFGSTGDETVTSMALDANGNIFLGGYFTLTGNLGGANMVSAGSSDIFLAKYDASGNHLWSMRFGGTDMDALYGLAVDSQGSVVISGTYRKSVTFGGTTFNSIFGGDTGFVAKYSSSGGHLWSQSFAGGNANTGRGVAIDKSNNVLLTGSFYSWINFGGGQLNATTTSAPNVFIAKLSSAGAYVWAKKYGDLNTVKAFSIVADSNGDVAIAGEFHTQTDVGGGTILGTAMYTDVFLAKYSGIDGSFRWVRTMVGNLSAEPTSIAVDAQNNLYVTGYYYGSYSVGGVPLNSLLNSYDVFVVKYSTSGAVGWARSFGGTGTDQGFGVVVAGGGYPIVTGNYSGTGTFGAQTLSSAGSYDAFVQRLAP